MYMYQTQILCIIWLRIVLLFLPFIVIYTLT